LTARSDALMAMGGLVRLLTHDFTHETIYRSHAAFDFAAPKELGAMDIPGGPIGQSTVTKIFVFHPLVARSEAGGKVGCLRRRA
jgi:hypothetical protein